MYREKVIVMAVSFVFKRVVSAARCTGILKIPQPGRRLPKAAHTVVFMLRSSCCRKLYTHPSFTLARSYSDLRIITFFLASDTGGVTAYLDGRRSRQREERPEVAANIGYQTSVAPALLFRASRVSGTSTATRAGRVDSSRRD